MVYNVCSFLCLIYNWMITRHEHNYSRNLKHRFQTDKTQYLFRRNVITSVLTLTSCCRMSASSTTPTGPEQAETCPRPPTTLKYLRWKYITKWNYTTLCLVRFNLCMTDNLRVNLFSYATFQTSFKILV